VPIPGLVLCPRASNKARLPLMREPPGEDQRKDPLEIKLGELEV